MLYSSPETLYCIEYRAEPYKEVKSVDITSVYITDDSWIVENTREALMKTHLSQTGRGCLRGRVEHCEYMLFRNDNENTCIVECGPFNYF